MAEDAQQFGARQHTFHVGEGKGSLPGIYHLHSSTIEFQTARWDPANSDLDYGDKTIDQQVDERDDGSTQIIHNNTDAPFHVAYEESVDLTNSFSSSITKGVTLDMTEEAGAASPRRRGAEVAGVKAEVAVAANFGVSRSKSESSEEGKEESEEGTTSKSLAIDFDADPGSYYLVEIKKENSRTSQPYDIDGVMDFDILLTYYRPEGVSAVHPYNQEHVWHRTFEGVDALTQYVHGYDTDNPEMQATGTRPRHTSRTRSGSSRPPRTGASR